MYDKIFKLIDDTLWNDAGCGVMTRLRYRLCRVRVL